MRALVVQHDHVSPLGPIADRLEDRGYDLTYHQVVPEEQFEAPGVETAFPGFDGFDAVVLMGAPWAVYDPTVAVWVEPEQEQVRRADRAGVPVLGICFGGQILAATFGGAVRASSTPEIGWHDVHSDREEIVPGAPWFQWHYDRWDPPPGADEIARNPAAPQAFVLRHHLAVQFHPELTLTMLEGWLDNGGAAEVAAAGLDPATLLEATRTLETDAGRRAAALVDGFLDHVVAPAR